MTTIAGIALRLASRLVAALIDASAVMVGGVPVTIATLSL
jgi:hypothetical protein